MTRIAEVFSKSFEHETWQARVVMKAALDVDLKFTPKEGMKPLGDLANHLAQIPSLDFSFYKMEIESMEQAQQVEKDLRRESISEMLDVYDAGVERVINFFEALSDDEFLDAKITPCYQEGDPKPWSHYFPDMIRHVAMHKMQLWMYLKLSGEPIDMMLYYGVPPH
ncbi:MAG: DinB family protein [Candidatus Thorarchaeota archaeon]